MVITSKENDIIKEVSKLVSSAKFRQESGKFVAEGVRLCVDGAISGAEIETFLYTKKASEKYQEEFGKIYAVSDRNYEVSERVFMRISDTKTPQGFICVLKRLDKKSLSYKISNQRKYFALENIQDPSNLGTILRTAEALGADGGILSRDCCDVYSPKVVRGSMGAIFRVPLITVENFTEYIRELTQSGIKTYASTPHQAENISDVNFKDGGVMLIGNEGNGLKEETIKVCYKRVRIPMKGRAESLNAAAAAAILMYKLQE